MVCVRCGTVGTRSATILQYRISVGWLPAGRLSVCCGFVYSMLNLREKKRKLTRCFFTVVLELNTVSYAPPPRTLLRFPFG